MPRYFSIAVPLSLLLVLLWPLQSASAGGCCFREITIQNLATGREVVIVGPALTAGYDLSTFWSFTDFKRTLPVPARSRPSFEVNRDGWDHLRYYPGVGDAPGVIYYEGLFNGSSEYDRQWFAVPPEQDAALRQVLAVQGLTAAPQPWFLLAGLFALSAIALVLLYLALGSYTRRPVIHAAVG